LSEKIGNEIELSKAFPNGIGERGKLKAMDRFSFLGLAAYGIRALAKKVL
jgi:hypothetical protein